MGYEIYRLWYARYLRVFLDKNGLYTNGTEDDFKKLYDFIDAHTSGPEPEVMYEAAVNILERSDVDWTVVYMMDCLENGMIVTGYYKPV